MARILMVNVPYAGHTNPTLPLAALLVRRGHSVCYVNAEEFRAKIESTGAEFVPYQHFPAAPTEQQKKTKCFRAAFDTALGLGRGFDLLVYEMFFYPGEKLAQRLGVPCVRQFSQPAWRRNMAKDAPWLFRLSCTLIDRQVMSRKNKAHMGLAGETLLTGVLDAKPPLNIVYVPEIFQQGRAGFGRDYLFTVPVGEADLPPGHIPYGAMKPPIAYISLGSIISNRGFCKECIRAFGKKPVSVILNTGRIAPKTLGPIPDNIHAYAFVPQLEVLRHADVFLTHCGMNSVNEAMRCGVPMVAMPFVNDQIANAKRLVELGIARRVRSFPSSGRQLHRTVRQVYGDKLMQARSAEVRALLEKETTLEEAAGRIEALLGSEGLL